MILDSNGNDAETQAGGDVDQPNSVANIGRNRVPHRAKQRRR